MQAQEYTERTIWSIRAERLLNEALGQIESPDDVLSLISAADACIRIDLGEKPEDDLYGYPFPDEDEDNTDACTCPPALIERGGFRSTCPVHG
jgi:hypothetical protein